MPGAVTVDRRLLRAPGPAAAPARRGGRSRGPRSAVRRRTQARPQRSDHLRVGRVPRGHKVALLARSECPFRAAATATRDHRPRRRVAAGPLRLTSSPSATGPPSPPRRAPPVTQPLTPVHLGEPRLAPRARAAASSGNTLGVRARNAAVTVRVGTRKATAKAGKRATLRLDQRTDQGQRDRHAARRPHDHADVHVPLLLSYTPTFSVSVSRRRRCRTVASWLGSRR